MDHEKLLDAAGFWADVTAAVEALGERRRRSATHLKPAAEKLRVGREPVFSGSLHWLDWVHLDPKNLDAAVARRRSPPGCRITRARVGRNARATRGAGAGAVRGTEGEAPARPAVEPWTCAAARTATAKTPCMPVESQLWNLRRARATVQKLFGVETDGLRAQEERVPPAIARRGSRTWASSTRSSSAPTAALIPTHPRHGGELARARRQVGRRVHARAAARARPAHVLQPRLPPAPGDELRRRADRVARPQGRSRPFDSYHDLLALAELGPVFGELDEPEPLLQRRRPAATTSACSRPTSSSPTTSTTA